MAETDDIPEDVKDFLRRYIRSVGQLDILYLLMSDPSRPWTAEKVAAELRTNLSLAASQLEEMRRHGLVQGQVGEYKCCGDKLTLDMIGRLIYTYNLRRPSVIHYLYSQPMETIRSFADAFIIKKDLG